MNKTNIAAGRKGETNRPVQNGARNGRSNGRNGSRPARGNGAGNGRRPTSAKRSARQELELAIKRYADLYEFAPVGYITFDRSGRTEEVNLAACQLFGAKREYLVGSPFSLCVVPGDLGLFLDHLVRCRSDHQRIETNLRLKKRNGQSFPALLSTTTTMDPLIEGNHIYQTAIVDLTLREQAEQVLREKEAELEQIVTQTPFMLTRCTRDMKFRYASRSYAKMVGCEPEDLAGKPIINFLGPEGLKAIRPHVDRVLQGETTEYEAIIPYRGGESHYLHCVYVPDRDVAGNVIGWIASIIDITERKKAETAVRRLAALVQTSHDAIVAKDLNGIITDWNNSAERIFGYTAKEIIGKSILTIIPGDRRDEEAEILGKIRRGQSIDHYQTVRRRKDGTLIDVSLTISPVMDNKGKIIGVSKIARDITAEKKAERQLSEQARLLDLSNDAILVRDANDRIVYWNHGAKDLYGYSAKEALGKITHKLLQTQHPEQFKRIQQQVRRNNHWSGELVQRRKDGTNVVVMSRWVLDRDARGRPSSILETNTDITQRKRAELSLQRSKELLERLVEHRTRALRVANSELESEITRRKGLEGQILEISDREQERLGQELHDGLCQRLTAIAFMARASALRLKDHRVADPNELEKIAQLINASVTDARNIARDLHKEEIDAAGFVDALRGLAERQIWKTPCRIHLTGDITIEDDRTACEVFRILREGVINANKHARASEIVLEVARRRRELVFSVTDNGIGLKNSAAKDGSTPGLGTHIMHYRAQSVGARIELESPRRGGTRLAVYLPLSK